MSLFVLSPLIRGFRLLEPVETSVEIGTVVTDLVTDKAGDTNEVAGKPRQGCSRIHEVVDVVVDSVVDRTLAVGSMVVAD